MNDSAQSVTSSAPHHLYSNRYRYYVLALLTLGYVFNFVVIFTFIAGVPSRCRRTGNRYQTPA